MAASVSLRKASSGYTHQIKHRKLETELAFHGFTNLLLNATSSKVSCTRGDPQFFTCENQSQDYYAWFSGKITLLNAPRGNIWRQLAKCRQNTCYARTAIKQQVRLLRYETRDIRHIRDTWHSPTWGQRTPQLMGDYCAAAVVWENHYVQMQQLSISLVCWASYAHQGRLRVPNYKGYVALLSSLVKHALWLKAGYWCDHHWSSVSQYLNSLRHTNA